jgi:hypothetical protein
VEKRVESCQLDDHDPKYDIRDWFEGHKKMAKGITLVGEEIVKLA